MADVPGSPQPVPGFPENARPLKFETFSGMNTKATRPAVKDTEMPWCDGLMPLGPSNLRTLPDVGDSIYTAPGVLTIIFYEFGNCGQSREQQHEGSPIAIIVLSDGSAVQVNTETTVETAVAAAGTFTTTTIGMSQWGNQYIILVADQENGYFLWDGVNLYTAGTLGPQIDITDAGTGYTSAPSVGFTGGSGTGAAATAVVQDGAVVEVYLTNPGAGYVVGDTPSVTFSGGGGTSVTATCTIMPFGIRGTAVETYTSRVWVSSNDEVFFTAPSSPQDFSNTNGGGDFRSTDSFLKVGYTFLQQSNGFLYLIADSSINYISGVQTTGDPPVTTFTNLNVDPQIGTPYPHTVQVFSRNIVFANNLGVFVSVGGAVTKVSSPLDGIWNTVPSFGGQDLSGAVANIFGIQVYMVLAPIIDPYTGQQVNKLLMWDGNRWWASEQSIDLTFVSQQEITSVLTAWGTDDTSLYPMFQEPSVLFRKVVESKLWDDPAEYTSKQAIRVAGIVQFNALSVEPLQVFVDNEAGASADQQVEINQNAVVWTNDSDVEVTWTNDSMDDVTWYGPSLVAFVQAASQSGRLLGMTFSTLHPDLTLVKSTLISQWLSTDI